MSETLSQDPDLNSGYTNLAPSYPPTSVTPSSTVQDGPPNTHLPPFSTFSSEMDSAAFNTASDRLFSDTRLLDISNWDYYTEARLLDRGENGLSIITSQPQYRPWESKSVDSSTGFTSTNPVNTFAESFAHQNGVNKLPSFQSQFQSFNEPVTSTEATTLTTLTNLTPVSPNPSSPGSHNLTTLNSNFHTLSAVNPRGYPLVPAPIQAREIPSIQQQFLDERHIQLYTHPAQINNTIHSASIFPTQNGTIIQNNPLIPQPTVVTVLKSEPELKLATIQDSGLKLQNIGLHPTQFQNPMSSDNGLYNGLDKKLNGISATMSSPTRNDFRKKERRKMRASSLESSAESDGASSNMEISENSGQVAAISSTAGFKSHHSLAGSTSSVDIDEISGGNVDKQVKKKRKRCGECIGCQRKDNCGDCAPCRNDKSHQICKQRRCEKLTEKKNLYGEAGYLRGESRRGRGKGRGAGSYRGRKPSGPIASVASGPPSGVPPEANGNVTIISNQQPPSRPSPQPVAATVQQTIPVQQQSPMTPMPFYADPNRFPTPVWQTDPTQAWPQGQFIQQIPASQATLESYQQYPNGIYQATYQQPTFETNTFYTGAVQVLTNARPPSAPNQQTQLTSRPNSNYSHNASPAPSAQVSSNRQTYQEYNQQNQNFVSPATTPSGNAESVSSRPSSVNSTISNPAAPPNQNFNQQSNVNFTPVSSAPYSPGANPNYATANSGNAQPGYPQVNSNPQLASHSSSGYPGSGQYSGTSHEQMWQEGHIMWENQEVKEDQNFESPFQGDRQNEAQSDFLQSDRVNLNTRIKTMILSKQQNEEHRNEDKTVEEDNSTGHFLWYSHHHRFANNVSGGGGSLESSKPNTIPKLSKNNKTSLKQLEIPNCNCSGTSEAETYFIHLGHSNNVINLWNDIEHKTRVALTSIKMKNIKYTEEDIEGKTEARCPISRRIIPKSNNKEKYLIIAKQQPGHICSTAFIVSCIIMLDGFQESKTTKPYIFLTETLNRFTTKRRCDSNTTKTCSCQGKKQENRSAGYSFGNNWSMYFIGCKFATLCKFMKKIYLNSQKQVNEKLQKLAYWIGEAYRRLVSTAFENQCLHKAITTDHRLGYTTNKPFSGATACLDFCAHNYKVFIIFMVKCCIVVVTLTKHKLTKSFQKQLNVFPLYVMESGDESLSNNTQEEKKQRRNVGDLTRYQTKNCENALSDNAKTEKQNDLDLISISSLQLLKFDVVQNFGNNLECFAVKSIGVGIALGHGSMLFKCARHEVHATTTLTIPNRKNPSRVALVFSQHKNLNKSSHRWDKYTERCHKIKYQNSPDSKIDWSPTLVGRYAILT